MVFNPLVTILTEFHCRRKIELNKIIVSSCWIPCLLISLARQLEILMTALNTIHYKHPPPPRPPPLTYLSFLEFDLLRHFKAQLKTNKCKTHFDHHCYSLFQSSFSLWLSAPPFVNPPKTPFKDAYSPRLISGSFQYLV